MRKKLTRFLAHPWRIIKKSSKKLLKHWKNLLFLLLGLFFVCVAVFMLWVGTFDLPSLDSFKERKVSQSTKIYDRTGEVLLYDVYQNIRRTVVPFDQISQHIKDATLSIEDREFYQHDGVKLSSFIRAVLVNLQDLDFSQGGSTITQQVVKNSLLTGEKRISRKIKEWVLAWKLEKILTKEEILSMYLNEIPYGGSMYGVEEASNSFFGKHASDLTIAESAYLAALPKAPTYYSPYRNRDRLDERKNLVIDEMFRNNYITEAERNQAKEESVVFKDQKDTGIKAPHFVMYVKDILTQKYGEDVLENGGLIINTTLDYTLQEMLEKEAKIYALDNAEKHDAENIASVALDPKTGEILAMVGSRDYFDEEIDGNFNVALAKRQPGSSFKPFAYAKAFSKGYTPETILFDVQTQFNPSCEPTNLTNQNNCYAPTNYTGTFKGPMSLRDALAQSINVPAIKVLYLSGLNDVLRLAKDFGISTLSTADRYGLTLVLGGGEVTLLEMASAYGVFANEGVRVPHNSILSIKTKNGATLEEAVYESYQVISRDVALEISDILSDDAARAPIFGANSYLNIAGKDVAVKTGTTNDYKDAWIVGYSPDIVLGAWVGNNDNTPMDRKVAGYIVAPFWNKVMRKALENYPNSQFATPSFTNLTDIKPILRGVWKGSEIYTLDSISEKLATEYTPPETQKEVSVGEIHTILHYINKSDPYGAAPSNPASDGQYNNWEFSVQKWLNQNNIKPILKEDVPTEYDDVHTPENIPEVKIQKPYEEEYVYKSDEKIVTDLDIESEFKINRVDYFINSVLIGSSASKPFQISFIPSETKEVVEGKNDIRVVVTDEVYNKSEAQSEFTVEF